MTRGLQPNGAAGEPRAAANDRNAEVVPAAVLLIREGERPTGRLERTAGEHRIVPLHPLQFVKATGTRLPAVRQPRRPFGMATPSQARSALSERAGLASHTIPRYVTVYAILSAKEPVVPHGRSCGRAGRTRRG